MIIKSQLLNVVKVFLVFGVTIQLAMATDVQEAKNNNPSECSSLNIERMPALLTLEGKAMQAERSESYPDDVERLNLCNQDKRLYTIPAEKELEKVVSQETTRHFYEHSEWLKRSAGCPLACLGVLNNVLFDESDYTQTMCEPYDKLSDRVKCTRILKTSLERIRPRLVNAILENSAPIKDKE